MFITIGTNEGSETEMTVTSKLHAQAEGAKKWKREEKATSSEGAVKDPGPDQKDGAQARGRVRRGPRPRARAADDLSALGSGLRARQTKGGPHTRYKWSGGR